MFYKIKKKLGITLVLLLMTIFMVMPNVFAVDNRTEITRIVAVSDDIDEIVAVDNSTDIEELAPHITIVSTEPAYSGDICPVYYTPLTYGTGWYKYIDEEFGWHNAESTFRPGGTYKYSFALYCNNDKEQQYGGSPTGGDEYYISPNVEVILNGEVVELYDGDYEEYRVWAYSKEYSFPTALLENVELTLNVPQAGTVVTMDGEDNNECKYTQDPRPSVTIPLGLNCTLAEYYGYEDYPVDATFWYEDEELTNLFSGEMVAGGVYYADVWISPDTGYVVSGDVNVALQSNGDAEVIKKDIESYDLDGAQSNLRVVIKVEIPAEESSEEPIVPQNGIPLVIIRIDESEEAINNASSNDPEHEYGTIEEMNASKHHTTRCVGTAEIILPEGYEGEYDLTNNPVGEVELEYIRGRGNSTWMLSSKKPYKIKYNNKQDVLGMGSNKEWGLLANSYDPTLSHNDIVSWLGEQMDMEFTSKMVPVDLVMIGSESGTTFLGSYCITELVDVGKNRVDIKELDEDDVDNITGGYLLSIYYEDQDFREPENTVFETEYSGIKLINENPYFEEDVLTEAQEAQRAYIRDYVNQIDDLIMNNEEITEEVHNQIAALLDLRSAADYWLVQEFTINFDAFKTSSNYLYKKRDGKLYWGPLWDFDLMFYMIYADDLENSEGFNRSLSFAWMDRLRNNDPLFVDIIKEEWDVMNEKLIELTKSNGVLDELKENLRDSWNVNYELYKEIAPYYGNDTSIDKEFEDLRKIIEYRREWFNANIDDVGRVFFKVSFKVDDEIVKEEEIRGNEMIEIPGDIKPKKDGYLFKGWVKEGTSEDINSIVVLSDITFVPSYVKASDIKEKVAMYFSTYEDWVPLEYETYSIHSITFYPEEQDEFLRNSVSWKSSNEEVATIDENGEVSLLSVGETTITGSLFNGTNKSYLLHVYDEDSMPEFVNNPTELKVEKDEYTLEVGESAQIIWELIPGPVNPDIYINVSTEVSDENIVAAEGICASFIGLKEGKVTIKLTVTNTDDDNYNTFEKDIVVNVKAKGGSKSYSGGSSSSSSYKVTTKIDNGTITPENVSVKKNANQEFTFKANEGYEIADVLVDGKSVGMVSSYKLEKVTAKHTIEVKTVKSSSLSNVDDWAKEEMARALDAGLIPEILAKKDARKAISRLEFVHVAVKLYEAISGKKAEPVSVNPFTDTNDEYVLKAYSVRYHTWNVRNNIYT